MKKPCYLPLFIMTFALFAITDVRAAHAEAVSCPPSLNGITVSSVRVTGGTCHIRNTRVEGNIKITGGIVDIRDSYIGGNIQSDGGTVRLHGGVTVARNLSIKKATQNGGFLGDNNEIQGNVHYSNSSGFLTAHYGTVGGEMRFEKNTGSASIVGNSVGGDLRCSGNDPPPTGFDNQVDGKIKDQCASFEKAKFGASAEVRDGKLRREPKEDDEDD